MKDDEGYKELIKMLRQEIHDLKQFKYEVIRLEKYKDLIRQNVSKLLNCSISRINIKAKSSDQIGIIGKSKGIACMASILIYK